MTVTRQKGDRSHTESFEQLVYQAVLEGKHGDKDSGDDNPGEKVGKVDQRLDDLPKASVADLQQQQGQDDGSGKIEDQFHETDDHGIEEHSAEYRRAEEYAKIFKPHPTICAEEVELLKGKPSSPDGDIVEYDEIE
jgi:hypothetical protein